ncbi:MAG: ABC-2 transporter permease [Paludibacteraceae bacterium]|nr:ABC-2 transporter permease [Paludibacteraceae bacterium]
MYRKELSYYFSTPIAYIVIGLYLLAISLFLWVIPGQWNIIDSGYAQVDGLFQLSPWLFMLLCPALTMRLFSEERQSGMWDLLRTKPVSLTRIVLGKYFAAWTLVLIGLMPCWVHYFVVAYMAEPMGNLDSGAFMGSFIGLILLSGTFLAIGLLCATFSKSQIVCFISGALSCFVLYWVLLQAHYSALSRGVIDMRDVTFFVTIAVVAVIAAIFTIDRLTRK